jgi:hypothetical protein
VARPDEVQAVFERIRAHGELIMFEHAGHLNFPESEPERYQRAVLGFIRGLHSPPDPTSTGCPDLVP